MENMENVNKPKRKRVEVVIVLLVVLAVAGVLGFKMQMSSKVAKENALMSELRAARTAVQLYMTLNRTNPPNLSALVTQKYTLGEKQGNYLSGMPVDKENVPLDAFGNKLNYDPRTGRVWSGTKHYENW